MTLDYKKLGIINTIAFVIMIFINAMANIIPLNKVRTGDVAIIYKNQFTPAKITFGIWGIIYLALGLFIMYQLGIIKHSKPKRVLDNIGVLFIITCILNSLWIIAWHYEKIGLTLVIMLLLLGSLIGIYLKLNSYGFIENRMEKYFVMLPFSIYAGWITIATIANITVFIVSLGIKVSLFTANIWLVIMLMVGGMLAVEMIRKYGDIPYALVVIWAYIGIIIRWTSEELKPNYVAIVGASIIIGMILSNIKVFHTIKKKNR